MKINAISYAAPQKINFEGSFKKDNSRHSDKCPRNCSHVSNSAMTNALKAMVLVPTVATGLSACGPEILIIDDCHTVCRPCDKPQKPIPPAVKDTLYMGHIYELPEIKTPVRDFSGKKLDSLKVKSTQAYIPTAIEGSPLLPVMSDYMNVLGLSAKKLSPAEGKNKAVVDGLPLQFVISNGARQSVSVFKFDGFNSTDVNFAYNEVEYNAAGNVKSSTHYDFSYVDDKSLYVTKYDNFAPEKGETTEVLQLNKGAIERLVHVGDNRFSYDSSLLKGTEKQSILVKGEHSQANLTDIKVTVSEK